MFELLRKDTEMEEPFLYHYLREVKESQVDIHEKILK